MSSLRRRALIVAGAAAIAIGAPLVASPGAHAATCAKVTIYINGAQTPIGSCYAPGTQPIGYICAPGGFIPINGWGATWQVCVLSPVLNPA